MKISQSCLKASFIPVQSQLASTVYIPKTNPPNPSPVSDIIPIALLNVEGKLLSTLISRKLEDHITENKIVNPSTHPLSSPE